MTDGEVTVLESLRWQFALSEMRYALRQARKLDLNSAAKLYEAALARETYRVVFARFVKQATEYGRNVAENARQSNPRLTPGQVRQIDANASAWYGNSAVQKNLLASARKVGTKTYELTVKVKPGEDLDAAAYKVYRGLSRRRPQDEQAVLWPRGTARTARRQRRHERRYDRIAACRRGEEQ